MRRRLGILALLGLVPAALPAQDFAPGVLLLARVKAQVREELERLPDTTCTETIDRFRRITGGARMRAEDSVRLEILFSGDRELYAAPGKAGWSSDLTTFIGSGMFGDGIFALHLKNVLLSGGAVFTYRGESRFDFHIPSLSSGYTLGYSGASAPVAERGSLWVNPDSKDVVRLEIHADEIPRRLPFSEVSTVIEYTRVLIGGREVLLPAKGELHTVRSDNDESLDRIEFTGCHAFQAESSVSFDAPHH